MISSGGTHQLEALPLFNTPHGGRGNCHSVLRLPRLVVVYERHVSLTHSGSAEQVRVNVYRPVDALGPNDLTGQTLTGALPFFAPLEAFRPLTI